MVPSLQVDFAACILGALGCILLPLNWFLAAIFAALFHELCHYTAARVMAVTVRCFAIGAGGAMMETEPMTIGEEMICAAAGPVGSLLLMLLIRWWPEIAICGLVQGIYNLLPIYPLDGGRLLNCALNGWHSIVNLIQWTTVILILGAGVWASYWANLGMVPLFIALFLTGKAFLRKIPCKQNELRVQ